MKKELLSPNYIFETSWEVCNKVGGIYTVLSSRAKTLKDNYQDQLVFIGPDLKQPTANVDFKEDAKLFPAWKKAAANFGVKCRIGRWMVPGEPVAVLVDFEPFLNRKTIFTLKPGSYSALILSVHTATTTKLLCFHTLLHVLQKP